MPASNLITGVRRRFTKTIAFDGTAGNGGIGTVVVGTVTGAVLIKELMCRCKTTGIIGAATLEFGVAGNTASLIAQIADAEDIDGDDVWIGTTAPANVAAPITNKVVAAASTVNLILTIGSAAITAGQLEFIIEWVPLSSNGHLD